jgi:hypothetical protein
MLDEAEQSRFPGRIVVPVTARRPPDSTVMVAPVTVPGRSVVDTGTVNERERRVRR